MRLFTIAFVTKSYGRGVAVVAAHDADEAYTVLVSYGQLNHSPEEYGEILDIKDSGCSSFNVPTLLEEELTAIKVIIGEPGNDGKSIYELCIANGTFEGTEEEFVAEYNAAVAKAEVAVKEEEKRKAAEISREQNTKEALKNMSVALEKVNTAIVNANTAAEKTNEVISTANTAAENAKTQAANAETATSNAESATEKANNAAINADNSRKAIEQNTAVVKTSEQTLTEEQQVQARENIGIGTVLTDIASTQAALSVAEQGIATNASDIKVLQEFADNNQMMVGFDDATGEVYVGLGSWNTTFDSGEIDEVTGEVTLNVAS